MKTKIAIVYHSGYGHTKMVAEHIAIGAAQAYTEVSLLNVEEAAQQHQILLTADAIVWGSPTYFGNVSAEFKKFMESTSSIWGKQLFKDKLAAGFTNSSTTNGDKLHTLISLALFAAQHGMLWVPLGILPEYDSNGHQTTQPNGMASYLGLMTLSSASHDFQAPQDLYTATLFGQRIAHITHQHTKNKQQ